MLRTHSGLLLYRRKHMDVKWNMVKDIADTYKIDFENYFNPLPYLMEPDSTGKEPGQLMICGNRGPGKTTSFCIVSILVYKIFQKKFVYIFRTSDELESVPDIFGDALSLYPKLGKLMESKVVLRDLIYEIYLDGESVGFSVCIGTTRQIDKMKKYSPIFKDTYLLIFEEFLTESGCYLKNEITKLQSLLVSISRGKGQMSAPRKMIYLANQVALMNPYFVFFNVYKYYHSDTKIIHMKGINICFNHDERSQKAIQSNPVMEAFTESQYMQYASENQFLIDTSAFIQKPKGRGRYIATIVFDSEYYGLWEYMDEGFLYFSTKYDKEYRITMVFKAKDHAQNRMLLSNFSWVTKLLKDAYNEGYLRFNNEKSKMAAMEILAIDLYK